MTHKKAYKSSILLLKYFPIFGALFIWISVLLIQLYDYHNEVFELFCGTSILGGTLLILASIVFEFCRLHKMFIFYDVFAGFCIDFQTIVGFGIIREPLRITVLVVGIILFLILIYHVIINKRIACFINR